MHATATDEVGLLTSKGGVCVDVLGGSPGRWWQIKQKRPTAPLAPLLSSSPLSTLIEAGRQKWVAMAECIIFEMLSHRPSADAGRTTHSRIL